jgi:hypothetical protein
MPTKRLVTSQRSLARDQRSHKDVTRVSQQVWLSLLYTSVLSHFLKGSVPSPVKAKMNLYHWHWVDRSLSSIVGWMFPQICSTPTILDMTLFGNSL